MAVRIETMLIQVADKYTVTPVPKIGEVLVTALPRRKFPSAPLWRDTICARYTPMWGNLRKEIVYQHTDQAIDLCGVTGILSIDESDEYTACAVWVHRHKGWVEAKAVCLDRIFVECTPEGLRCTNGGNQTLLYRWYVSNKPPKKELELGVEETVTLPTPNPKKVGYQFEVRLSSSESPLLLMLVKGREV